MSLETFAVFGIPINLVLYLLVENAGNVKLLPTPVSRFLAGGGLSAVTVALWAWSEPKLPTPIVLWGLWAGLWILTIMTSAAVKQALAKAQDSQQPPAGDQP